VTGEQERWGRAAAMAVLGLGAMAGAAMADDTQVPEFKLGEVVVTGAAPPIVDQATTVQEVTAEDIAAKGARTLDEALDLLPGLFIRVGGDGTPRMDIRGLRTRNILLLLDGVPLNSTFDNQWDPTLIPVENIARIKMTRGASSVLYGDGGNAGVINIITKRGQRGLRATLSVEAGQGPSGLVRGTTSAGTGDTDVFLSGDYGGRDAFPLSDDFMPTPDENGGYRLNSDRKRLHFFGNAVYRPDESTEIGVAASHVKASFGLPPVVNPSATDPFASKLKFDRTDRDEGYTSQVGVSHRFDIPLTLRSWLFVNELAEVTNRYDDSTFTTQVKNGSFHEHSLSQILGGATQLAYDFAALGHATLALAGRNEHFDSDTKTIQKNKSVQSIENRNNQIYSTALEYEMRPWEPLGIVLGVGGEFQERDNGASDQDFTYVVGATLDATDTTRLHASHAKKIRFPSLKELFDGNAANPNLVPERTYHYEVGVDQRIPQIDTTLGLTGFVIDAENFIEQNTANVFTNFELYRFQGLEFTALNRSIRNLSLSLGYTYLDSKNRSASRNHDDLQYRPRHKFSAVAQYSFDFGLSAYVSYLLVADQRFFSNNDLMERKLADYHLVNVKVSQVVVPDHIDVYARVDNLFDTNYDQAYGLPQAGRVAYVGADVKF
jgi:outer membrane cobalamin receptor